MKNKNFAVNLLMVIFISGLVSGCQSDPPVFDKGNLIGRYTGECTITIGSITEGVQNVPAVFKQKDTQSLFLDLGDDNTFASIGISAMRIASGFKDHGSYASFDLESMSDVFSEGKIPSRIKSAFNPPWDIVSMTLSLNISPQNPPRYTIGSKNLTFTYTGGVDMKGRNPADKMSSSITYKFSLNKQ